VAGTIREEDTVVVEELLRVDVVRVHRDRCTRAYQPAQDRPLAAVVDDGDLRAPYVAVDVRLARRDLRGQRATAHRLLRARDYDRLVDGRLARHRDRTHRTRVAQLQHER